eukprot:6197859-Pleurochrysis_carterae.AAC.1
MQFEALRGSKHPTPAFDRARIAVEAVSLHACSPPATVYASTPSHSPPSSQLSPTPCRAPFSSAANAS